MRKPTRASKDLHHKARDEDMKICEKCGKIIIGEYDFVQTKRRTKLYFHKGMKCV